MDCTDHGGHARDRTNAWAGVAGKALDAAARRRRDELSSPHYRPDARSSPYEWVGEARDAASEALGAVTADGWPAFCAAVADRLAKRRAAWRTSEWSDPDGYGAGALGDFIAELERQGGLPFAEAARVWAPPPPPTPTPSGPPPVPPRVKPVDEPQPAPDPQVLLPDQRLSGLALFGRWLLACGIDYGGLGGILVLMLAAGVQPLVYLMLLFLVGLFAQPLLELTGGTPGQRLAGIRLVAPGSGRTPAARLIILRHGYRMGGLWGVAEALALWRTVGRMTPADRLAMARNRNTLLSWMFIER
ncbi:RDD family protein [Novispirillum sp. DQ9]|uniref:RDD family protein n=1 Tax=Novispirillum sp. DQ9 TaxID=3398612 RepID=UPI003C7A8A2F